MTTTTVLPLITDDHVNLFLASIAEPGDGDLGRVLAEYSSGPYGRRLFCDDLQTGLFPAGFIRHKVFTDAVARWTSRIPSMAAIERMLATMKAQDIWSLAPQDDAWPTAFDDLGPHAPVSLFGRGDASLLGVDRSISIVGARAATGYGEHMAMTITEGLAERGYVIVSGGAYGIDGMAHRAALAAGAGTIAFLAGGVDRFYPMGHEQLLQRIAEHGLVVSEMPPDSAPTKWRFLQRNRLIAALSKGSVVVEAGTRSGSLSEAGHALALGRVVMAVPGPVTSPASAGTHRILREWDGTILVTSADEIIASLESKES